MNELWGGISQSVTKGLLVAIAIEVCYRSYLDLIRNRLAI